MLDLQERMDKTILKIETPNRSSHFNIQKLIEEHNGSLNTTKNNCTTETI